MCVQEYLMGTFADCLKDYLDVITKERHFVLTTQEQVDIRPVSCLLTTIVPGLPQCQPYAPIYRVSNFVCRILVREIERHVTPCRVETACPHCHFVPGLSHVVCCSLSQAKDRGSHAAHCTPSPAGGQNDRPRACAVGDPARLPGRGERAAGEHELELDCRLGRRRRKQLGRQRHKDALLGVAY